ncbi:MAG: M48 family metalloprotease [Nocardioidaceae bacterium]|nr:M48 family metalloprotease [Nocardioidaceae bacterium]
MARVVALAAAAFVALQLIRWQVGHPAWGRGRPVRAVALLVGGGALAMVAAVAAVLRLLGLLVDTAKGYAAPSVSQDATTGVVLRAAAVNVGVWLLVALVGVLGMILLATVVPRSHRHRELRRATSATLQPDDEPELGVIPVVVVEADWPAAMGLPGPRPRIVVSTQLCDALPRAELAAVVAHEEAHLRWHHADLARCVALAPLLMPRWGLVRDWDAEIALLLELAADDAAARVSGLNHLAAALRSMARLREDALLDERAARIERRLARHAVPPGLAADLADR